MDKTSSLMTWLWTHRNNKVQFQPCRGGSASRGPPRAGWVSAGQGRGGGITDPSSLALLVDLDVSGMWEL